MPAPLTIFYAEDDQDDLENFCEALAELQENIKLTHLYNGRDLMNRLKEIKKLPDIIFLDINMPLKNGYECIKEIRSDISLNDLPVAVLSTSSSPDVIQAMFEAGASRYIIKPDDYRRWSHVLKIALSEIDFQASSLKDFVVHQNN